MTDVRQSCIRLLASSLEKSNEDSVNTQQCQNIAEQIEQAVFQAQNGQEGNAYKEQIRSLSLDLGKNNVELAQQLLNGQVTAVQLINMDPEQLKSSQRAKQDEVLQEQNMRDARGSEKIPVYQNDTREIGQQPATTEDVARQGFVGAQEEMMGEEGDFKQRNQPRIAGLEGIEFETGN